MNVGIDVTGGGGGGGGEGSIQDCGGRGRYGTNMSGCCCIDKLPGYG